MKKFIAIALIVLVFSFTQQQGKKANAGLPVTDAGNIAQNAASVIIEAVIKVLNETLEGWENWYMQWIDVFSAELKLQATQALVNNVSSYITTGNNGSPYYVQNWDNYLYQQPRGEVDQTVNSGQFFSSKNISSGGYDAYKQQVFLETRDLLWRDSMNWDLGENSAIKVADTEDLSGRLLLKPENEFKPLQALLQPTEYPITNQQMLVDDYLDEVQANSNERAAKENDGYLPKEVTSDGVPVIVTPAATHERMLADSLNMGNEVIVNADDPYEFLMGSLTGWIEDTITDGLGPSSIQFDYNYTANERDPSEFLTETPQQTNTTNDNNNEEEGPTQPFECNTGCNLESCIPSGGLDRLRQVCRDYCTELCEWELRN